MHLHESISHTYADVGRKAIVTCDMSGTGIDPLAFLPPVVHAEIVQQWKAWQAIQHAERVPALDAHEADYQPRLERLLRFLLAPSTQLFGNKYISGLRPDISVIAKEELYLRWSNLLWCAELETNLQDKYHHGLGQAWSYSGEALLRQRGRQTIFVVCILQFNPNARVV